MEKSSGNPHPKLEPPIISPHGVYLWEHYWSLRQGNPITYSDIKAYCDITGAILDIWECKGIMAIDRAVEGTVQKHMNKMSK